MAGAAAGLFGLAFAFFAAAWVYQLYLGQHRPPFPHAASSYTVYLKTVVGPVMVSSTEAELSKWGFRVSALLLVLSAAVRLYKGRTAVAR